jgi:hypothetical protein
LYEEVVEEKGQSYSHLVFQLIHLGAYWNRIELEPGTFETDELDWQINAAELIPP